MARGGVARLGGVEDGCRLLADVGRWTGAAIAEGDGEEKSCGKADQEDQLLSSESEYYMDKTEEGNPRPRAEEHLPDYIRAYFDAAALDEIGFSGQARQCEASAPRR